jgi:hypothetical protein
MNCILGYAVALVLCIISVSGFVPVRMASRPQMVHNRPTELYMGGKTAKFGVFSPAVIVAKTLIGETKYNNRFLPKLRGVQPPSQADKEGKKEWRHFRLSFIGEATPARRICELRRSQRHNLLTADLRRYEVRINVSSRHKILVLMFFAGLPTSMINK